MAELLVREAVFVLIFGLNFNSNAMILDTLANLSSYRTLLPAIEKVADFLSDFDFGAIPREKVYLDGENLFMIPSSLQGKKPEEAFLEAHNAYADIQICLSEQETFGWADRAMCLKPQSDFDADRDIIFFDDRPTAFVTIRSKQFVLFMPSDAHAPLIYDGDIVKLIFKIRVA